MAYIESDVIKCMSNVLIGSRNVWPKEAHNKFVATDKKWSDNPKKVQRQRPLNNIPISDLSLLNTKCK